jgi:GntR family transcriptional regulator, uxu operon transcriptional repressor
MHLAGVAWNRPRARLPGAGERGHQGGRRLAREGSTTDLQQRLRQHIAETGYAHNDRLPPERALSGLFNVGRTELRRALGALEADGLIWRHVGRGTFVGARTVHNLEDVALLGQLAKPGQVLDARVATEPELARLAAMHASRADLEALRTCTDRCRNASDWRTYEAWDNNFHLAIARATHNKLLIYLFDTLNVVRRSTVWSQPRSTAKPPDDHPSFSEHEAVIRALEARDPEAAAARMRDHLSSVRDRVLPTLR